MLAEASKDESRSRSLAADREDMGLWVQRGWRWDTNVLPCPPPSSLMCNSKPAGREKRGEAQAAVGGRKGEAEGVMEGETEG